MHYLTIAVAGGVLLASAIGGAIAGGVHVYDHYQTRKRAVRLNAIAADVACGDPGACPERSYKVSLELVRAKKISIDDGIKSYCEYMANAANKERVKQLFEQCKAETLPRMTADAAK